jgi:hypothetical protein
MTPTTAARPVLLMALLTGAFVLGALLITGPEELVASQKALGFALGVAQGKAAAENEPRKSP